MLCGICKQNEATVHLSHVDKGKVQKIDLCKSCSEEKGINDPTGFQYAEMLLGLSGLKEERTPAGKTDIRCPQCGFTQQDLKKTGRLGCPECYEAFAEPLANLLKSMHRGNRHVGKAPRLLVAGREASTNVQELEALLQKLIDSENFEQAAVVRDEIKEAKAKLKAPASPTER
jgi:protein arginine kinase activator